MDKVSTVRVDIHITVLDFVIRYCELACEDDTENEIAIWAIESLDVPNKNLCAIIEAAEKLQVKGLLHLIAGTMADNMKGKTEEQIRAMLGFVNDF
ncbi:hypothetical protein AALP_AA5G019900 [Arabis alpina]|uniref:SKP1 component dimerisation domain-containing protein n=1 Tax=Arabis alpina TaxID=50452 RepID=A0A087GUD9_ARAAL|nr:hypothetical protein AALP_AA5G019900 [Arabis alpina]